MAPPLRLTAAALAPRKKPLQARAAVTVAAILQAAAHILEREGLAVCSTNAVALHAGVSIGSLYQYFPSRDAITKALILAHTAALVAEVEAIDSGQGGRSALCRLVDVAIAHQLDRPILARILDMEQQRLPIEQDLRRHSVRLRKAVRGFLMQADMPSNARLPDVATDLLAIIRGMVDGAGSRRERRVGELQLRVRRAVFGYLDGG